MLSGFAYLHSIIDTSNVTSITEVRSASQYIAPHGECYCNTLLCCNYFHHRVCQYLKFGHHPHPLGHLCAKFCFFRSLHSWASPWRKIVYSINQSLTQLIWSPGNQSNIKTDMEWWRKDDNNIWSLPSNQENVLVLRKWRLPINDNIDYFDEFVVTVNSFKQTTAAWQITIASSSPLGYLCAKFSFFHGLHWWASPWRKITYSITQSLIQLIWCPMSRSTIKTDME